MTCKNKSNKVAWALFEIVIQFFYVHTKCLRTSRGYLNTIYKSGREKSVGRNIFTNSKVFGGDEKKPLNEKSLPWKLDWPSTISACGPSVDVLGNWG